MARQQFAQRPSDPGRTVLTGARIARPSGVVEPGRITVEGGRIGDVHSREADLDEAVAGRVVDLTDHLIVPGFVDMHVHGGGGGSFSSADPEECMTVAETHRRHGTTSMVASTVTGELTDLARQAAVLAELIQQGELAGIHFEGPFISAHRCGAHQPELLRDPDPADVRKLLDAAHGTASMMTVAPELPGGLESVRLLADAGVIAALGHTDSDYDATRRAIEAGATVATHLFNAMPPLGHRAPGPVAALLEDERITVELINDGTHLHPAILQLAVREAGAGRVAFITDAMGAAGMNDGMYPLGPMQVEVKDGVARISSGPTAGSIAGSTLTLDRAFRRAVTLDGLTVGQAVQALSATPARLLGIDDRTGSLQTGKDADLVVLDAAYELVGVMRRGEWVVRPKGA
ncbi:N-acetylglucosamine 6-phosphate deacetylase [Streptomyces sp. 2224.1]|uniref:N-acetylglucosamine-6-phosphate deacetylase n=1 Tax=unclassified Streptomyces TaxID=2593676 RepID=UPI0008870516|nr:MULTISPECIES: N-acetylglucosamine-6-phosphate deacetylase [unclassified Streptomyces]PBC84340.1 N-acetylglucosamine 6-phosphate deacetylase [Streptomyces sp. 2321.6]SDR32114.1 N-acetylglucosamine 6-phosphate deacetylase [Streptomyces sp. KS_16]SEB74795.1 N-acetylglucosamine 6-phosphate deacetylase [Streptomyces sp. 2224.1]SED27961.1 N-acetylglucosamine 6-phosphate deacetylase [Streptomyces sp. 2133.1]SEE55691.1 N-acetylglucosamine 6-phosphate deacetylase [Streptomyces sp. 2112.3]